MSIYHVKLSEFYPPGDPKHSIVKFILKNAEWYGGCFHCKKGKLHWQQAIGFHALPYGYYGSVFCREKCYRNYLKKSMRGK